MSKIDPGKIQGKIREQMNREVKARREYAKKWSFMSKPEINQFYDQSHLNAKIDELVAKEKPEKSSSVGESYFVSKAMFDALNLCRCGRKQDGVHLTKCMQKGVIKYSEGEKDAAHDDEAAKAPNIPRTSSALPGFYHCKYTHLERSTNYVTPKKHLKHKIIDSIYNSIIIG